METITKTDTLVELLKRRLAIWDAQDSLDNELSIVLQNTIDDEVTPQIRKAYGL